MANRRADPKDDLAHITPAVLTWAIDRSAVDRATLAKRVGVNLREIRRWETGEVPVPFDKAQKLADALGVPFGALWLPAPPADWPQRKTKVTFLVPVDDRRRWDQVRGLVPLSAWLRDLANRHCAEIEEQRQRQRQALPNGR